MSAGSVRGRIGDGRVFAGEALPQYPFKAAIRRVALIITIEEIPAHLVGYDTDDKFGTINFGLSADRKKEQYEGE